MPSVIPMTCPTGNVSYTDYDDKEVAQLYGDTDDGTYGVQVGITHKF